MESVSDTQNEVCAFLDIFFNLGNLGKKGKDVLIPEDQYLVVNSHQKN